jgi:hypothetical protein
MAVGRSPVDGLGSNEPLFEWGGCAIERAKRRAAVRKVKFSLAKCDFIAPALERWKGGRDRPSE